MRQSPCSRRWQTLIECCEFTVSNIDWLLHIHCVKTLNVAHSQCKKHWLTVSHPLWYTDWLWCTFTVSITNWLCSAYLYIVKHSFTMSNTGWLCGASTRSNPLINGVAHPLRQTLVHFIASTTSNTGWPVRIHCMWHICPLCFERSLCQPLVDRVMHPLRQTLLTVWRIHCVENMGWFLNIHRVKH